MGERLYRSELDAIQRIIRSVARRQALFEETAEDFAAYVHEKLIQDDYALLRKFQGRSSFKTFLTVAVTRLALDFRNHKWGKWRPSEAARRKGDLAVTLERLTHRDSYSLQEACQILRINLQWKVSDEEVEALAAQLPPRLPRVFVGEAELSSQPDEADLERNLLREEAAAQMDELQSCLQSALSRIGMEDRLMVRMHFEEALSWTQIAEAMNVPRKLLYRRKDAVLRQLRDVLEEQGVSREKVLQLLSQEA